MNDLAYLIDRWRFHQRAAADAERDGHHDQADAERNEVAAWTARLEATR